MVVRMRHTKSHTKNRRSHHALASTSFAKCENCQALKRRHTVCSSCGFYRGKKVMDLVKKLEKKQKKAKAKKAATGK
ncbi:MAG: 50S ribosomal protein L32 [Parcubacteria group bacterium GW2011_GWC1_40_11]|nr:MAG: 50S ribosomal protein L32 [Parcubacteria group bacterium GW2011_GWC1_40_11]HBA45828.1 50S ribosomal protein L32 [Candidatus Nomurabacteria bacterium]HBG68919.1 50S ribosomal protein L32 [Candidatus Nomurabacteria bacterium]